MAGRATFNQTASFVDRLTIVQGQFQINGTSNPNNLQGNGVASVSRTSAGLFRITLSDSYNKLVGVAAIVAGPAAGTPSGTANVELNVIPSAPVSTIDLRTSGAVAGTAADPADDSFIMFTLFLRNSSLKGFGE